MALLYLTAAWYKGCIFYNEVITVMASTNPFADLDAHQELMDQMQKTNDAADDAIKAAGDALEDLSDHNNDLLAHPLIRERIDKLEETVGSTGNEIVEEHNVSSIAHQDIRALITQNSTDIEETKQSIETQITAHSNDVNAHPTLQAKVNDLSVRMGDLDVNVINNKIEDVKKEVEDTISQDILDLQTTDARHDKLISTNISSIESLTSSVNTVNSHVATIAGYVVSNQTTADDLKLKAKQLDLEEVLGYSRYNASAPSLLHFSHDLGNYVKAGSSVEFHFFNSTAATSSSTVTYTVEKGEGNYTLVTPDETIYNGTGITLNVDTANSSGEIIWFTAIATDSETGLSVKRVIPVMIARPLAQGLIDISSLTTYVEPGRTYDFQITNLADSGDGRYSYTIEPGDAPFTFSKVKDITESEALSFTVAEDAKRDVDHKVTISIVDSLGETSNIEVVIHVNALPSISNFYTNAPDVVVPGTTYDVKFNGVQSAQGHDATFSVTTDSEYITFSKAANILTNENIKITISADAPRGEDLLWTIHAIDENDITVDISRTFSVNILPSSNDIITTLPLTTEGGKTISFIIYGGADAAAASEKAGVTTYDIEAEKSGFRFNKITGIKPNENVTVTIPKVPDEEGRSFSIYAVDDQNERSANPKNVAIVVEPIVYLNAPTITYPKEGNTVDTEFTMTWSAVTWSVDTNQTSNASEE